MCSLIGTLRGFRKITYLNFLGVLFIFLPKMSSLLFFSIVSWHSRKVFMQNVFRDS